ATRAWSDDLRDALVEEHGEQVGVGEFKRFQNAFPAGYRSDWHARVAVGDIARLQDAGVPLHVKRGPGGGYRIDARPVLPPVTLTPGEASALVASLVAVGPYTSATAQSALAKLLASLIEPSTPGSTGPSAQR
ncbi:MAG: NAD-glutamate dehydrogenase, partial [Kitasatospora sp.]|nr:NAD-glutamate dehydrogenase [Kitasatospora sp.]